jgi:hypothetical protein
MPEALPAKRPTVTPTPRLPPRPPPRKQTKELSDAHHDASQPECAPRDPSVTPHLPIPFPASVLTRLPLPALFRLTTELLLQASHECAPDALPVGPPALTSTLLLAAEPMPERHARLLSEVQPEASQELCPCLDPPQYLTPPRPAPLKVMLTPPVTHTFATPRPLDAPGEAEKPRDTLQPLAPELTIHPRLPRPCRPTMPSTELSDTHLDLSHPLSPPRSPPLTGHTPMPPPYTPTLTLPVAPEFDTPKAHAKPSLTENKLLVLPDRLA